MGRNQGNIMKYVHYILLTFVLLTQSCSKEKVITGTVRGEEKIELKGWQKAFTGAIDGIYYFVEKDNGGGFVILVVDNGEDPLKKGDNGQFSFGEKYFTSTYSQFEDGVKQTYEVNGYELKAYSLH